MSYGIDENTKESNVPSTINAGIQENIKITSVKFAPMTEGQDSLIQVNFQDEYGATLQEILWPVDEDQVASWHSGSDKKHKRDNKELGFEKGDPITVEDQIKKEYALFNQRAKHIAARVASEEEIVSALKGAGSYAEFGEAFADIFTESRISNAYLRLKVVLNNKDYAKLPKYPPFVESMDVPSEKSNLEIDPKYDRVTKANADSDSDDPMSMAGDGADLPDETTW